MTRHLFLLLCSLLVLRGAAQELLNWQPAPRWEDASLLGNGDMGAAIYGHPHQERIILTHARIYLPTTGPFRPIDQAQHLDSIRSLILQNRGQEAAKIPVAQSLHEGYPGQIWNDPFVPALHLLLRQQAANVQHYQRRMLYPSGELLVEWTQDDTRFVRRQFVSRTDSVLVLEITASKPFDAEWELVQHPVNWNEWDFIHQHYAANTSSAHGPGLLYQATFKRTWQPNIVGYQAYAQILATDGQQRTTHTVLQAKAAHSVLLALRLQPFFWGQTPDTAALVRHVQALPASYTTLLQRHTQLYTPLYQRVQLQLASAHTSTRPDWQGEVLMSRAKDSVELRTIERQFAAARHNILSASGSMPPNLQGIWSNSYQPPWASDYTHDGNLPVAISSFLPANSPELLQSFFDYHEARLPHYRYNAARLYHCRGIQVPSHTSSHGWNVHFDPTWCLSFWNGGAAWTSAFFYDYWLHTLDTTFLQQRAFPFMREAALFYEDFLTPGPNGKLVFNPSYSPENNPANLTSQATINATMDVALAKELLRNLLAVAPLCRATKQEIAIWKRLLDQLPAYENDPHGSFREWLWPGYDENHAHRHISQLYGLYDRIDPEIAASPQLLQGVRKALIERLAVRRRDQGGIMVFGLVQMAWVAANLGDAVLFEEILHWLASQYWSHSLATFHDPNGLFNMDLSGGYQAVVIRALMQSDIGRLHLLPAKPASWHTGQITGLLARNGLQLTRLAWQPQLIELSLQSRATQTIQLILPAAVQSVVVQGKTLRLSTTATGHKSVSLPLRANESVHLRAVLP